MADSIPRCMSAALIQKLHALAERRREHLLELQQSGRWTRYYTQEEFAAREREVSGMSRIWKNMLDTDGATDGDVTHPAREPGTEIASAPAAALALILRRPAAAADRDTLLRRVSAG